MYCRVCLGMNLGSVVTCKETLVQLLAPIKLPDPKPSCTVVACPEGQRGFPGWRNPLPLLCHSRSHMELLWAFTVVTPLVVWFSLRLSTLLGPCGLQF